MQVTETLNEGLKRGYAITVPATELEAKVTEKLEEARKDFQMKGFRKGKAPAALMKKMFGKSVLGEAMQETIDKAMRDHFEASGDRPALQPEVKMTNEDWKEGEDVEVSMTYEALPQVPEVAFGEIKLEKLVAEIDDAAVDEALENLAESAKDFEDRKKGVEGQGRRPGGRSTSRGRSTASRSRAAAPRTFRWCSARRASSRASRSSSSARRPATSWR